MKAFVTRLVLALLILIAPVVHAELSAAEEDERTLREAGLSSDGAALLAFFHARARTDIEHDSLHQLLHQFVTGGDEERVRATAEMLALGSLALQVLRQTVNDLDHSEAAARASRCLTWLEGPSSHKLVSAAARVLAQRKPEGAAAALLAYLPYADNADVIAAINTALAAVATPAGKADPALLRGLNDRMGVRRAAAGVALCRAVPPQQVSEVRKLLQDRSPKVRLRAAKALAEAKDAESIPVLIDLLAELPADERQSVEDLLKDLAGEWAPLLQFATEDDLTRAIRRDAWASWWRGSDGPFLLAALAKHTLTPDKAHRLEELLKQLGSDDFAVRESASSHVLALGRLALPRLREVVKDRDVEVSRRAKMLIERLETRPEARLALGALRLLAVRKPSGAVEALLAYLPFADDEDREQEVRKSLIVLARRDGKLDSALTNGLADVQPKVRAVVAEALIAAAGTEGRAAIRKLLLEDVPSVRMRAALALARAGEREGVSVLIDLFPLLSAEERDQAEDALYQLAGDTVPTAPAGESDDNKKRRDAWAAWWKVNASRIDLDRMNEHASLGYTLITGNNLLYEIDRDGNKRWGIENLQNPIDAVVLPGNRVLIAEYNAGRVTERNFQGKILWQKDFAHRAIKVQRLPNGHTFIAGQNGPIMEVDRDGKEIYAIPSVPGGFLAAYRSRQGNIVCVTNQNCQILDTTGKQIRSFPLKYQTGSVGCLDVMSDGRFLIAAYQPGKVMEYDNKGKLLREWEVPAVVSVTGLPNGHILACSHSPNRVIELDRAGKVVWERKTNQIHRARRR